MANNMRGENMKSASLIGFLIVSLSVGVSARASNSWVGNCETLKNPAMQAQIGVCTSHPGCKLFIESQRDCAAAGGFLDKLMRVTTGKQKITASDVFEAAAPPVIDDPEFSRASQALKSRFDRQTGNVTSTGVNESRNDAWAFKGPWVYEGPMMNGQRHGVGIVIDGGGRLFRGDFIQGRQAGKGEYIAVGRNKRHDVGDTHGFDLNGSGIRRTPQARTAGQFLADRPHGRITQVFANGGRYEGEYAEGKKHGQGVEIYANGHRYEGAYVNGKRHGNGTYTFPSGERYVGEFANDNYHGQGTLTLPNGIRYVGTHVDDKRFHGQLIRPDGTVMAVYVSGQKQGENTPPSAPPPQASIDQQQADAERERKEARRRDRREALGVLRTYADTSASIGNQKPADRLGRIEALTRKPAEGENRVSTALNTYADRLNRKASDTSSPVTNPYPTTANSPPPANTASSTAAGQLSQQQIMACDTEIMNMQRESQNWRGDINERSNRLGRYQKSLFEGRCARHPQAAIYIRNAEKMMGYRDTSHSQTPAPSGGQNDRPSPTRSNRDKSHLPHMEAHNCLSLITDKTLYGGFKNSCNFKVHYGWCAFQPKQGAWNESADCEKQRKLGGGQTVGPNSRDGQHTRGATIYWFACKGPSWPRDLSFERGRGIVGKCVE